MSEQCVNSIWNCPQEIGWRLLLVLIVVLLSYTPSHLLGQDSIFESSSLEPLWTDSTTDNLFESYFDRSEAKSSARDSGETKTGFNLASIEVEKKTDKFLHSTDKSAKALDKALTIGGYAKLDYISDFQSAATNSNGEHFNLYALIPLEGSPGEYLSNSVLTARESRLFVDTTTETAIGKLTTKFEGDFFGANASEKLVGGFGFRLRRAFGDLRGFRAGQDFSTFMDPKAFPETLTLSGPVGFTFLLQGMIRYTSEIRDGLRFVSAIENPYTGYSPNWAGFSRSDRAPDFHLALEREGENGHLRLRSFLRSGSVINDSTGDIDTSVAWGLGLSGRRKFSGPGELRFDVKHGVGLGRYVFEGGLGNQGWAFDGVDLSPIPATGGYINYRHRWNKKWRANLIYGFTAFENGRSVDGGTNRMIQSYHTNVLFNPIDRVTVGLEYSFAQRKVEDGRKGERNRLQLSVKYSF